MSIEIKDAAKVEIKKLILELDGKEISLTIDSAEKLYKALQELFDKRVVVNPTYVPYPIPYRPWYWGYDHNYVYCGSSCETKLTLTGNTSDQIPVGTITCSVK